MSTEEIAIGGRVVLPDHCPTCNTHPRRVGRIVAEPPRDVQLQHPPGLAWLVREEGHGRPTYRVYDAAELTPVEE